MTRQTGDDADESVADEAWARYAQLDLGDESLVIYDRENHQAWIQSSLAVGIDDLQ